MLANWIEKFMLKDRWTKYKANYRIGIILLAFVYLFRQRLSIYFFQKYSPTYLLLKLAKKKSSKGIDIAGWWELKLLRGLPQTQQLLK